MGRSAAFSSDYKQAGACQLHADYHLCPTASLYVNFKRSHFSFGQVLSLSGHAAVILTHTASYIDHLSIHKFSGAITNRISVFYPFSEQSCAKPRCGSKQGS